MAPQNVSSTQTSIATHSETTSPLHDLQESGHTLLNALTKYEDSIRNATVTPQFIQDDVNYLVKLIRDNDDVMAVSTGVVRRLVSIYRSQILSVKKESAEFARVLESIDKHERKQKE